MTHEDFCLQRRRRLITLTLVSALPLLNACMPAVLATGAAVGVISFHDRRLTGVQADDEVSEWKGSNRLPARHADKSHVNFTSFNRVLLITGEVPDQESRQAIEDIGLRIEGIRKVHNELLIAPLSSLSSRSNDAFISSKFIARLLEANQVSINHIKSITENGTLFLMGIVNEREAKATVATARSTDGVRKVVNLLEILPDAEIRRIDQTPAGSR